MFSLKFLWDASDILSCTAGTRCDVPTSKIIAEKLLSNLPNIRHHYFIDSSCTKTEILSEYWISNIICHWDEPAEEATNSLSMCVYVIP